MRLVQDYTAGMSAMMNRHLRGIERDETCEAIKDDLYWAMSRRKKVGAVKVYRGVRSFPALDALRPDDCFIDKGYMSTSLDESVAVRFTGGMDEPQKILFEILSQSGRSRLNVGGFRNEKEVILLPGTPLKLKTIEHRQIRRSSLGSTENWIHTEERRYFFREVDRSECVKIVE